MYGPDWSAAKLQIDEVNTCHIQSSTNNNVLSKFLVNTMCVCVCALTVSMRRPGSPAAHDVPAGARK